MKKVVSHIVLIFICICITVGCATIMHGSNQDINISSTPNEAEVWIDGAHIGNTPTNVTLKRKDIHTVTIKKEGYKEARLMIKSETSAWLLGNIFFGGLLGLAVDLITGGAYYLEPEIIDIELMKLAELHGKTIQFHRAEVAKIAQLRFIDRDNQSLIVANITWID